MDSQISLDRAIALFEGIVAFASVLELDNYQTVQQWRKSKVPAERCIDIEKATNGVVTCEELRPDVDWSYLRGTERKAA